MSFFFLLLLFNAFKALAGSSGGHSWVRLQQLPTALPIPTSVCTVFFVHPESSMAAADGGIGNAVRECALKADCRRKIPWHDGEWLSVLLLACGSDALPAELSRPVGQGVWC